MKATLIAKNDISKDNSQWKLQTSLPEAEANLITSKTGNLVRGLIIATAIISFIIMVFTKLFPCIRTSLPQVFCDRWNEFWFSLSVSVFAAIVFYFIFTLIPAWEKKKEVEPLIHYDTCSILIHLDTMFAVATNHIIFSDSIMKDSFVEGMVKWDWEKKYPYVFKDNEGKNLLECIKLEVEYAYRKLESIQKAYNSFFSNDELAIISHTLLHHAIFSEIHLNNDINDDSKNRISGALYDFYWTILDFSRKFRTIPDSRLYRL